MHFFEDRHAEALKFEKNLQNSSLHDEHVKLTLHKPTAAMLTFPNFDLESPVFLYDRRAKALRTTTL